MEEAVKLVPRTETRGQPRREVEAGAALTQRDARNEGGRRAVKQNGYPVSGKGGDREVTLGQNRDNVH